jgi:hypothetical protein
MRWRRHGRDRWADLIQPAGPDAAVSELAAEVQAEAEALARACTGPTVILECGVRVPAYLSHVDGDEL